MKRFGMWVLAVATAASACVASAASLGGVASARVGNAGVAVGKCDTNGVTATYTTSGGNITAVTVAGLADPACEGGVFSLTVADGTGASIASGGPQAVAADGDAVDNSVVLAVSPQPPAEAAAAVHVSIVGP